MTDGDADDSKPETIASSYGVASDPSYAAVVPPLYLSSTYAFAGYEQQGPYDYGRAGNPTRDMLANALAALEGGAGAVITSSGMAAIDLLIGRLRPDGLVLAPHDCYGGTMRLLKARAGLGQLRVCFVDQGDMRKVGRALEDRPALMIVETPSNPMMRVVDIVALAVLAHEAGVKVAVDNTFLSPACQRPLELGADFAIHSTTKYLNGHSDIVGGAVIAADPGQAEELAYWSNVVGSCGAPFDAWLTLRGLRTLYPRMRQQQVSAMSIARYLADHPAVSKVYYPGLESHDTHGIALRQQKGFGAMLSFELEGGADKVRRFIEAVKFFTLAESLGGVESLVSHPATMTHADMGEEARGRAGIKETLLRLSVGLEAESDLIAGLQCGLAAC
ncbi:MAG: O-succinylhomoserine (thiol)-lyase [Alphaproteobacteria bacterium HGW-Alphaproteobacteria-5]|nr:MAG: O-succinylhomoserine (thiol)-lyase [Alphaproteobacteria bacterium HGW-Alphaproteobacteria-5]